MVFRLQKIDFHCFVEWFNRLFYNNFVLNSFVMQYINYILKTSLMYGSSWDRCRFMKNFRFDTICNITR